MTRLDARTQRNLSGRNRFKSIEIWHEWAMNEQKAQAQKKLYNKSKVYAIKIFSWNIVFGSVSKHNVIYMNVSIKV